MVIVEFKNGKSRRFISELEARSYEKKSKQKILKVINDDMSDNEIINIMISCKDKDVINCFFNFMNGKKPQKKKELNSEFKVERVKI